MSKKTEGEGTSRRGFLKLAATGAPAAVAAAALPVEEAEAAEAPGTGMQDTEHTRQYYDTARF